MSDGAITRLVGVLAFLAVVAAVAGGVWRYGYFQALDQLDRQGASDLALASDRLKGQLQRSRELAVLVADHPQVGAVLAGKDLAAAEALFLEIADKTAAGDILLINAEGLVMAGVRGTAVSVVIGPLVQRAMQGALGCCSGQTRGWHPQICKRGSGFWCFGSSARSRGGFGVLVEYRVRVGWLQPGGFLHRRLGQDVHHQSLRDRSQAATGECADLELINAGSAVVAKDHISEDFAADLADGRR